MNTSADTNQSNGRQTPPLGSPSIIIAKQNDIFRQTACGCPPEGDLTDYVPIGQKLSGQMVMTQAISAEEPEFIARLLQLIATYDDFNPDCDPHDWHEMGVIEFDGKTVWFKFDYYDQSLQYGSENPADLTITHRVMTVLFPSDY